MEKKKNLTDFVHLIGDGPVNVELVADAQSNAVLFLDHHLSVDLMWIEINVTERQAFCVFETGDRISLGIRIDDKFLRYLQAAHEVKIVWCDGPEGKREQVGTTHLVFT